MERGVFVKQERGGQKERNRLARKRGSEREK